MNRRIFVILAICFSLFLTIPVFAADGQQDEDYYYFKDRSGNEMMAPKDAFATRVVS